MKCPLYTIIKFSTKFAVVLKRTKTGLLHFTGYENFIKDIPISILYKSIVGRYRHVRVADGPITARCRFIKNASWDYIIKHVYCKFKFAKYY